MSKAGTTPFEIESSDVSALTAEKFSILIGKLLSAEAQESDIPQDAIHVSYKINAPDGGEDARIEWRDGPDHTSFLPNRLCQFQMKTGKIGPAKAGNEVLNSKKELKPMIREVLERNGAYIMLCSQPYTEKAIKARENKILENIRKHLPKTEEYRVRFRDAGQIAAWTDSHPSAAFWLLKEIGSPLANPFFGNWNHWACREEHYDSRWVEDPRLPDFRKKLRDIVQTPKGAARVVGPSGTGKSRLALKAFRPAEEERKSGMKLSDLVIYAVESEAGSLAINELAWSLVNSKKRAVLVVDRCTEETRTDLEGIAKHSHSRMSLVTVSDGIPSDAEESRNILFIDRADHSLIEKIVKSVNPGISDRDRRRIVLFSDGVVQCAQMISKSWNSRGLNASDDDDTLIEKFIGHGNKESGYVWKAAKLIGALGTIRTDNMLAYEDPERDEALEQAAEISGISLQHILDAVEKLEKRGIVHGVTEDYHGSYSGIYEKRFAKLRPEHIAVKLAERQWRQWNNIFNSLPEKLIKKTVPRLPLLNTTPVAAEVARKICGKGELWFPKERLEENSQLLAPLAETDAGSVLTLLERALGGPSAPAEIKDLSENACSEIALALSKTVFLDNDCFENAARLLFKIAVENSSAEDLFTQLFPAKFAHTKADPEKRLRVIDEIIEDGDCLPVAVDALLEGAKTAFLYLATSGPAEIHGGRPALESWKPKDPREYLDYVKECVSRLVALAKRNDGAGERARRGLGRCLDRYILDISIDDIEKWTKEIGNIHPYCSEALSSLDNLLMNHPEELSDSVKQRVEALISRLEPDNLKDRVRFLVTEMPYGYLGRRGDNTKVDHDEMLKQQRNRLEQLAEDLLAGETELMKLIPELSKGEQRMAREFGLCLAEKAPDPLSLKIPLTKAVESMADDERNFGLLIGFMKGLGQRCPEELAKFKKEAAKSAVFAQILPVLTLDAGIASEDIAAAVETMKAGLMPPGAMRHWGYGRGLSGLQPNEVAPLFSFMLEKREPSLFSDALFLMGMYTYEERKYLEGLRPQLLLAAEYPSIAEKPCNERANRRETERNGTGSPEPGDESSDLLGEADEAVDLFHDMRSKGPNNESANHYQTLMNWLLSKGIEDFDAGHAAMIIAEQVAVEDFSYSTTDMIREIMPCLLSNFADLVWPRLGRAIAENESKMRYFLEILGHRTPRMKAAPILSLRENTLFGWCRANPKIGPAFAARALPVAEKLYETESYRVIHVLVKAIRKLRAGGEEITDEEIHPAIRRLLDEFGERVDVLESLESNIRRDFCGTSRDYIILFREPLRSIKNHDKVPVRRWVRKMLREIDERTEEIRRQDRDEGVDWRQSR